MQMIKIKEWAEVSKDYTGIVIRPDGTKVWYLNGKWHREDGPAYEGHTGYKAWYLNGEHLGGLPPQWKSFSFVRELENGTKIEIIIAGDVKIWPNLPGLKELADNWEIK